MKVHVDLPYVIDPVQERLFHPVSDGVAFIDADFAVHEDGQVDHEELPEAVRLDRLDRLYARYLDRKLFDFFIERLPGEGIHEVIR